MKDSKITAKPKTSTPKSRAKSHADFVAWLEADLQRLERKYAGFITDVSLRAEFKQSRRK